jgi:hypothetical protein
MATPKQLSQFVNTIINQRVQERSSHATVVAVDGNLCDLQLPGQFTYMKHCRIVGNPDELAVGMDVPITWEDYNGVMRPVVHVPGGGSGAVNRHLITNSGGGSVEVDDITIENSQGGIRVKEGGISIRHLDFIPEVKGHQHAIDEFLPGWNVTNDGVLFTDQVSINPLGTITFGRDPDIVKIGVEDSTYRLWAGDSDPSLAPFSVSKIGALKAHSGDIGGWNITSTQIKDDLSYIILDSSVPQIKVGPGIIMRGQQEQIQVGASNPSILIDGQNKIINSSNFSSGVSGFGLTAIDGDAEFNNVTVRGTIRASVFNLGELTATAGSYGVFRSAGEIYKEVTTPSKDNNFDLEVKDSDADASLFTDGDILRIKAWDGSNVVDVWLTINSFTPYSGFSRYNCKVMTTASGGVTLRKGTAVADYGQTGDGHIIQSADDTFGASANMSIAQIKVGMVNTLVVNTPGTGYTINDILTLTGGNNDCTVKVTSLSGTGVSTVTKLTDGSDYAVGVYNVTGGTGVGAQMYVTDVNGPWDTMFLKMRLGNMKNSYGTGAFDRYGIGIGDFDAGNYLSYNAESEDEFIIKAGSGAVTLNSLGLTITSQAATINDYGSVIFKDPSVGEIARVYGFHGGTSAEGGLRVGSNTWSQYANMSISVINDGTYNSELWINAYRGGLSTTISVLNNTGGRNIWLDPHVHISGGLNIGYLNSTASTSYAKFFWGSTQTGDIGVQDASWLRLNQLTAKNIYTPRMFAAAGGLISGSSAVIGSGNVGYTANLRPYRNSSWRYTYTYEPISVVKRLDAYATGTSGPNWIQIGGWGGIPDNAKAVNVRILARDSASVHRTDLYFSVGPSTTDAYQLACYPVGGDIITSNNGVVNCSSGGDLYWRVAASGASSMDIWLHVYGVWY